MGLIVEQATDLVRKEGADLPEPGFGTGGAPFLSAVELDRDGVIQRIHAEHLIPEHIREALFTEPQAHESR